MRSKSKIKKNKIKATPHTDVKQSLEYPGAKKNQQIKTADCHVASDTQSVC